MGMKKFLTIELGVMMKTKEGGMLNRKKFWLEMLSRAAKPFSINTTFPLSFKVPCEQEFFVKGWIRPNFFGGQKGARSQ